MRASAYKRKKRRVRKVKTKPRHPLPCPGRGRTKDKKRDWLFRSMVIGKSHDPRDQYKGFDTTMAEDEAAVRAGWGPGRVGP